ncbi:frizzled-10-A-like [Coregonus clupeaformis]|uniref:frizzled-10-A-like n=1 Tax=Coregonus clupeaformis TaxID=59861 RepID=UPI001E1C47B5|nr:frizzled-10-A-like [Coregonus clupeaformis]
MSKMKLWLGLPLLLALSAGRLDAWFWNNDPDPTTQAPTKAPLLGKAGAGGQPKRGEENLAGVGAEIINVADGIRSGLRESESLVIPTNLTGVVEDDLTGVEGVKQGELKTNLSDITSHDHNGTCHLVPSDWPICISRGSKHFSLPNFLNHTSVEEVGIVLREWAWLAKAGCHHGAEWFLCLLLVPRCPLPGQVPTKVPLLPCCSFCHVLQDSCWPALDDGQLPVECNMLPDRDQEAGLRCPSCVSVSNRKGKTAG